MNRVIEISHLTKKYENHIGIEDISFSVKKGEVFALLGSEESGKTTVIRSMLGLIGYNQGAVHILGKDVKKEKNAIISEIGYLPAEVNFYPAMTIEETLQFAAEMRKKDCNSVAKELCDRLELIPDKRVQELTLEEKKKLGIVCAMQHQPKLLILDEPTEGLSLAMQKMFFRLVREAKGWGTSCLLTTKQMSEVLRHCTNVAFLQKGRILKIDSVENLSNNNLRQVKVWKDGEEKSFPYNGVMHDLITLLAEIKVDDVLIEEPTLEEIFMQYQEEKEGR